MSEPWTPLPTIDLHLHLDGALRPQTILELGREAGVPLPGATAAALAPHVQVSPDCRTLTEFLHTFEVFYPVLRGARAVERMAREALEDAARAGAVYVEGRFAPVLQSAPDLPIPAVVDAALEGLHAARSSTGMECGLILCCYRSESPASSLETVRVAAARRKDGVVGVDLAGDEVHHPARPHAPALALAREEGLPITVHAGEAGPAANIREAVEELGAARLGHALALTEDQALREEVCERGIVLETCLTSNLQTGAVASIARHPFPSFLGQGLRVTLNTDDPGVSCTDIGREFQIARDAYDLTDAELVGLRETALEAAFCDEATRERVRSRIAQQCPVASAETEV